MAKLKHRSVCQRGVEKPYTYLILGHDKVKIQDRMQHNYWSLVFHV